jgi:hypothetical protein
MALNLSELQAMTDDYIKNEMPVDIYFTSNVLLFKLLSLGKTYPGGKKIQTNLEYDMSHTGPYGPRSELPIAKKEILNAAFFEYAAYYAALTIDMDDELINSGSLAIVNLVTAKLNNAAKSIRKRMAQDIYKLRSTAITDSGDINARPFTGLGDLFNTSSSTAYGEIKEDDMTLWKPNVEAGAKTMSYALMQEMRRTASIDNGNEGKPNLYVTTNVLQDAFERTLQIQARYSDQKLLDVGFNNILFKGAPIVDDDLCTANYIYGFNTQFLDVLTHVKRNFTKPEWKSPIRQPDTATANIRWAGNLVCSNRKAHVLYTNVTAAS